MLQGQYLDKNEKISTFTVGDVTLSSTVQDAPPDSKLHNETEAAVEVREFS